MRGRQRRLNLFTVTPDGYAALVGIESYLKTCGLDRKLMASQDTPEKSILRAGGSFVIHIGTSSHHPGNAAWFALRAGDPALQIAGGGRIEVTGSYIGPGAALLLALARVLAALAG